jgi:hypothetical protein
MNAGRTIVVDADSDRVIFEIPDVHVHIASICPSKNSGSTDAPYLRGFP